MTPHKVPKALGGDADCSATPLKALPEALCDAVDCSTTSRKAPSFSRSSVVMPIAQQHHGRPLHEIPCDAADCSATSQGIPVPAILYHPQKPVNPFQ